MSACRRRPAVKARPRVPRGRARWDRREAVVRRTGASPRSSRSSQCASSMSSASGPSSAHAERRLSVAAPIAKRSWARAGPSARAPRARLPAATGSGRERRARGATARTDPRTGSRPRARCRGRAGSACRRRCSAACSSRAVLPIPGSPTSASTPLWPSARLREQAIERQPLVVAAQKHQSILTSHRHRCERARAPRGTRWAPDAIASDARVRSRAINRRSRSVATDASDRRGRRPRSSSSSCSAPSRRSARRSTRRSS